MPLEPSVTSASFGRRRCTVRYSSALLPKSFERPGPPKSASAATNSSGVEVVVKTKWIVDMECPHAAICLAQGRSKSDISAPRPKLMFASEKGQHQQHDIVL